MTGIIKPILQPVTPAMPGLDISAGIALDAVDIDAYVEGEAASPFDLPSERPFGTPGVWSNDSFWPRSPAGPRRTDVVLTRNVPMVNGAAKIWDIVASISSIDDLKRAFSELADQLPLIAELKTIVDGDPSILDNIHFVDSGGGATYRSGEAIVNRDLPADAITLDRNTSLFVVVHELAHFLPSSVIQKFLPPGFDIPEFDLNAELMGIATVMLTRFFIDEAIAGVFEIQLAHDLIVAGISPKAVPEYVWREKEVFDTSHDTYKISRVYLGDNHKIQYPVVTALRIASLLKKSPEQLKELKVGDMDAASMMELSPDERRGFLASNAANIEKLMAIAKDFIFGKGRDHIADLSKFSRIPDELRDAVVVTGEVVRRVEVALARTSDIDELSKVAEIAMPLILSFKGQRFSRVMKYLLERMRGEDSSKLRRPAMHVWNAFRAKGYLSSARRLAGEFGLGATIAHDEWPEVSNSFFMNLTGRKSPQSVAADFMIDLGRDNPPSRESVFSVMSDIAAMIPEYRENRLRLIWPLLHEYLNEGRDILSLIDHFLSSFGPTLTDDEKAVIMALCRFLVAPGEDFESAQRLEAEKRSVAAMEALLNDDMAKMSEALFQIGADKLDEIDQQKTVQILFSYLIVAYVRRHKEEPFTGRLRKIVTHAAELVSYIGDSPYVLGSSSRIWDLDDRDDCHQDIGAILLQFIGRRKEAVEFLLEPHPALREKYKNVDLADASEIAKLEKSEPADYEILFALDDDQPGGSKTKKQGNIALPDLASASDAEIETFLEAWSDSLLMNQPFVSDRLLVFSWVWSLKKTNRIKHVEFALENAFVLCQDDKDWLFNWARLVNVIGLAPGEKDELYVNAVERLLPEPKGVYDGAMAADILAHIAILSPFILTQDCPESRKLLLRRIADYVRSSQLELGSGSKLALSQLIDNFLVPLLNLHPELVTESLYPNFLEASPPEDDTHRRALNTMFADVAVKLDPTMAVAQWDAGLVDYGTMDPDAVEARLLEEISSHRDDPDYPQEEAEHLYNVVSRFLRFRINEYIVSVGEENDPNGVIYSDTDLQEIPFLGYLYYALDPDEVREGYAGTPLEAGARGKMPPNPWDYLEDDIPPTPVRSAALKAVLKAHSHEEARAKLSVYLKVMEFDSLGLEYRQLATAGSMLAGFASPYVYHYYEGIKGDAKKVKQFNRWLRNFYKLDGPKMIDEYLFSTLLHFSELGIEKKFWGFYSSISRPITASSSIPFGKDPDNISFVYLFHRMTHSDRSSRVIRYLNESSEREDFAKVLKVYSNMAYLLDKVINASDSAKARDDLPSSAASLHASNKEISAPFYDISRMTREEAIAYKARLHEEVHHLLKTRREIREQDVALPQVIEDMPPLVHFLFAEYLREITTIEKAQLRQKMDETLKTAGAAAAVKVFLETKKLEKLGQFIYMLYGIVPDEWRVEFKTMLSDNQPAPFYEVKQVVESDLGKPIGEVFSRFDEDPIAVGTIAQVHTAYTKDGKKVAVKIVVPSRQERVKAALGHLEEVVKEYEIEKPLFGDVPVDIGAFFRWFQESMTPEFDLTVEKKNMDEFASASGGEVRVPTVHTVAKNVMVMEFVEKPADGVSVDDARTVIRAVLRALAGGIVHDDPHEGNVIGRTLFDFGRTERLSEDEVADFSGFLLNLYLAKTGDENTAHNVAEAMKKIAGSKKDKLPRLAGYLASPAFKRSPLNGDTLTQVLKLAGEDGLVLRSKMYAVIKALLTLDELGHRVIGENFSLADELMQIGDVVRSPR